MMTRRTKLLTVCGGLALGLGALLPLPTWAQVLEGGDAPRAERRDAAQQDAFKSVDRMQQDIKRMQRDLERARMDLEKRIEALARQTQDLNTVIDRSKRNAADIVPVPPEPRRARTGQVAQASALPANPTPSRAGQDTSTADFQKRLQQLEHKLDVLIQMMRQNQRFGAPASRSGAAGGSTPSIEAAPPAAPSGVVRPSTPELSPLPPLPGGRRSSEAIPAQPSAPIGF